MSSFAGSASENQFKTATTGARALTFDQSQLGAIVSGSFWLATRFRHKRAGMLAHGRDRRPSTPARININLRGGLLPGA